MLAINHRSFLIRSNTSAIVKPKGTIKRAKNNKEPKNIEKKKHINSEEEIQQKFSNCKTYLMLAVNKIENDFIKQNGKATDKIPIYLKSIKNGMEVDYENGCYVYTSLIKDQLNRKGTFTKQKPVTKKQSNAKNLILKKNQ